MLQLGADLLDVRIYAMMQAGLTDQEILRLTWVRHRFPYEPTWPLLGPRLHFQRYLADRGLLGRGDRHPTLCTIDAVEREIDFAGPLATQCPAYSGG